MFLFAITVSNQWIPTVYAQSSNLDEPDPRESMDLGEYGDGDFDESEVAAGSVGPDVRVLSIDLSRPDMPSGYGMVGEISAFSIGTTSCNVGDTNLQWQSGTVRHPVIGQNMYRLKNGRLEQIGMSWLKHGFLALNNPSSCGACVDPNNGTVLAPGCSDPYSASLNGRADFLGPRYQVNAHSGQFPYPINPLPPPADPIIGRRIQVHNSDLDLQMNAGALYFVEGQYIALDDATRGNGNNNASYRRCLVNRIGDTGSYGISRTGTDGTMQGEPAIRAWKAFDPRDPETESEIVETDIQISREGLLLMAAKATNLGTGYYHFEYAVQNLNSDRSVRSFSLPIPEDALIENIGFHDVDYHSGEPFDGTDWTATVSNGRITWSTEMFDDNPNANALRWGTMYNFRFDINAEPSSTVAFLGLFKVGTPSEVEATTLGPQLVFIDCNRNLSPDTCDISCGPEDGECDRAGCGDSVDCNGNLVPDECETDCNQNGVADSCDLTFGTSQDCNQNLVPDDCEPDCDDDGIPDVCDGSDADSDGVIDCDDLCPETTPSGECICPELGKCYFPLLGPDFCLPETFDPQTCALITPAACRELGPGWVPECPESPCNEGCLPADGNGDGRRDILDYQMFQNCFSGALRGLESEDCLFPFDADEDSDIDLDDYRILRMAMAIPE